MSVPWPKVKLGEVLKKSTVKVDLKLETEYSEVTIKLWGKGVIQRRKIVGSEIIGGNRFLVRSGQFILSRIDARNGAMGIVPPELDNAIVSNDFPVFDHDLSRIELPFLNWLTKTSGFVELCKMASEGSTNRVRLKENRFFCLEIPLPPPGEQRRIVARIEELAAKIGEAQKSKNEIEQEAKAMLRSAFAKVTEGAPYKKMGDVAPLVRRKVELSIGDEYPELGIRCFGRGTFHKPALDSLSVGTKKLYRIEPGDLLFSNVFAWEGAIAVAQPEDAGRVGSHRFMSCVPLRGVATADFLSFYFLTREGLEKIGKASPGGAGRNRTLGIKKLDKLEVPVPDYDKQLWFDGLQSKVREMAVAQQNTTTELDTLLPSILDKAFKGEL